MEKFSIYVPLYKPDDFADWSVFLCDAFCATTTAIAVNFDHLPFPLRIRLCDFLSGVAYALDGQLEVLSDDTILLRPDSKWNADLRSLRFLNRSETP